MTTEPETQTTPAVTHDKLQRSFDEVAGPHGTMRMKKGDLDRALQAAQRDSAVVHPGDVIADRYRVESIVDRSNGLLMNARHELFGQLVSLRLLPPHHVDKKVAERMRRQARAVAALDSEHVARILDAGVLPNGSMYVAREHINGDLLIQQARAAGGFEIAEAITVFVQVCEAVQEAHARGIVLRDLRPEHLLVSTKKSGEPIAKIADLGACMVPETTDENSCLRANLSPWASPEMIRQQRNINASADIWSLGCLLYELLCGERPFRGDGTQLMLSISHDTPAPPSTKRKGIPRVFDNIVRWALDKDPTKRPKSVHALVHALWPMCKLPGQLLIDRIARLAMTARASAAEAALVSDDDATHVLDREAMDSVMHAVAPPPPSSDGWEPPSLSLLTPVIPPPCPVPSMSLLDFDDPLVKSARRRGVLQGDLVRDSALTPI